MKKKMTEIRRICRYENEKLLRAAQNQAHMVQFGSMQNQTPTAQFIQAANRQQLAEQIMNVLEQKS